MRECLQVKSVAGNWVFRPYCMEFDAMCRMSVCLWKRFWGECLEIRASVAELLFPSTCVVCENGLVRGEKYLCTACLADFPLAHAAFGRQEGLLAHLGERFRPLEVHALFYYSKYDAYKNLIYRIKYRSYKRLAFYLGQLLGERIQGICRADCIVPVPLHPLRLKERGYNQAGEIGRGVADVLRIELLEEVVVRTRNNVSQTGKNAAERLKNVEHIFRLLQPEKIAGHHVLVLDDVITTGATVGACLDELAAAGEVTFSLGCLARTR